MRYKFNRAQSFNITPQRLGMRVHVRAISICVTHVRTRQVRDEGTSSCGSFRVVPVIFRSTAISIAHLPPPQTFYFRGN